MSIVYPILHRLAVATAGLALASLAQGADYPPHVGASPTSFDTIAKPSDTYVANDRDSSTLDRYLFRGNRTYDIVINIPIRRYLGEMSTLRQQRLVGEKARLYIPAFDIDANTSPVIDCDGDDIPDNLRPEVDEVYFNDERIGTLSGDNNLWKFNDRFQIPMDKIRFPAVPGETAINTVGIKIDVANRDVPLSSGVVGCQVWATEIDWAALKIEATSPIAFVPGLSGSPTSLANSGYPERVRTQSGLPSQILSHSRFEASLDACSGGATPSLAQHAAEMRDSLKAMSERFGADSVHLIAHSKGGLDARMFLRELAANPLKVRVGTMSGQPVLSELEVHSLATHGAPHLGTTVADYLIATTVGTGLPLLVSDLCDLSTQTMARINGSLPIPSRTAALQLSGNADLDGNGTISDGEATGNQVSNPTANRWHRLVRDFARYEVDIQIDPFSGMPLFIPIGIPNPSPQPNDTMVSIVSASAAPGARGHQHFHGKNHGTIIDSQIQQAVITQGISGTLAWRLK